VSGRFSRCRYREARRLSGPSPVWFAGCVEIAGATGAHSTVSVAALLVAVPALLVTTTRNVDPLSEVSVAGVGVTRRPWPSDVHCVFLHW